MPNIDEVTMQGLAEVHAKLIQSFLRTGRPAAMDETAIALDITPADLTERLNHLSDLHGLVLHPHKPEPWVVHPFSVVLNIHNGIPLEETTFVHFSIPPRSAWNNVHQHCSLVLPFRSEEDIAPWCSKHGQPYGEAVPIATTASLARRWYGQYADSLWRKWTVEQAQQIFERSGLTSPFWKLSGKGTY